MIRNSNNKTVFLRYKNNNNKPSLNMSLNVRGKVKKRLIHSAPFIENIIKGEILKVAGNITLPCCGKRMNKTITKAVRVTEISKLNLPI